MTILFFALSFIDSGFGYQASAQAYAAANSGAEEALLQLDRNPSFTASAYGVGVGNAKAVVTVTQDSPLPDFITVLSTATVANRTRNIQVVLSKNATTSQLSVVSWQETQ